MFIYLDKEIEKVGMGSEGEYGKYPTLIIKFIDESKVVIRVNKENFEKLKNIISHIEIPSNRWTSDGCNEDFKYKED